MPYLVFLAIPLVAWYLRKRSIEDTTLYVFLPILLLLPGTGLRLPHLPPISAFMLVCWPIALVAIARKLKNWRLSWSDLWVTIFCISATLGETKGSGPATGGLMAFYVIYSAFFPYILGKLVFSQREIRMRAIRQIMILLSIVVVVSLVEFRLGKNLFMIVLYRLMGMSYNGFEYYRGGFARVYGPFDNSILAGSIFCFGAMLALWYSWMVRREKLQDRRIFGLRSSSILTFLCMLGPLIALSRGPWIGLIAGIMASRVGKAKDLKKAIFITGFLAVLAGGIAFVVLDRYTSGDLGNAADKDQENAIYRRLLTDNYREIATQGGAFGWGDSNYPKVEGMESVDNAFLLFKITQGYVGYYSFLLLLASVTFPLVRTALRTKDLAERYFLFTFIGMIIGTMITLGTVALFGPLYRCFFLVIGWAAGLATTPQLQAQAQARTPAVSSRFGFRRIIA